MIVGTRYNKEDSQKKYDAILIGSGIGSLTTAALMAHVGKKVLVLESHYTAGGFTHTFSRKGYEWDVGLHYVGEMHREYSTLRKLSDLISDEKLEWHEMSPIYDTIVTKEGRFPFHKDKEQFVEVLAEHFPGHKDEIQKYVDKVRLTAKTSSSFFTQKLFPRFLDPLTKPLFCKNFDKSVSESTFDALSEITSNPLLKGVLSGQWGDYGLPPKKSPFTMHAMVAKHYFAGGTYPVGGSSQIAKTITEKIEKVGGKVLVKAEVESIIFHKNKAVGVKMTNGDKILSNTVISGAGHSITMNKLIKNNTYKDNLKPSSSHLCLYVGVNDPLTNRQKENSNLWVYPSYDHDANCEKFLKDPSNEFPVFYISFPSAKDPKWPLKNKSTIEAITVAPYEWFEKWEDKPWRKRGENYNNYKEELQNRMLEKLIKEVPEIEGKIDYVELSTPLSTKHFCMYPHGEIYGLDHEKKRFYDSMLRPKSPWKNLYFTGQDVVTAGIGGAMMAGVLTATSVLGPLKSKHIFKVLQR